MNIFSFIKRSILRKTVFLFVVIVFLPVLLMAYFAYGILLSNHNDNLVSGLKSGAGYINTIFEYNSNIVLSKSIKLKDDFVFVNKAAAVFEGKGDPSDLMNYLNKNYGFDFYMISAGEEKEFFYSETVKPDAFTEEIEEMNRPVLSCSNSSFMAAIKIPFYKDPVNYRITLGMMIDEYNILESSSILDFDFIIIEKKNGKAVNRFSTLHDEYGYSIPPGSLTLDPEMLTSSDIFTDTLNGETRKLLPFDFANLSRNYRGVISKHVNFEYLQSAKKYLGYLLLFFMVLTIVLAAFIRSQILSPVIKLLDGIRTASAQIEKGQPIESLDIKNKDEIGILADEYNRMATEMAKSFSRIKYLQNYLLNIFESMPSGLIVVDSEGKITQWNKNAEKYTRDVNSLKKGNEVWKSLPDLKIYKEDLLSLISEKRQLEFYREPVQNGVHRNVNVNLFPLASNGVTGSVIRIDDVSELKKKEEQLIQAQKMETIGTLAGGIAHDFNNILAGIVGVVSLLRHKIDNGMKVTDEILNDYLDIMEQSGNRAADIVQRLLTLSRKQTVSVEKVRISEVVNHVMRICSNTFDKSISIKGVNTDSCIQTIVDFTQLEQIILNLSINASHAMTIMRDDDSNWGGELIIEIAENLDQDEIDKFRPSDDDKDYFRISVKDNGVGMDPSTVKQIFEPFFSTKDKSMGTGLGLTIVYNVVQQSGGFIDIDSEPGKGTEFKIYMPKYFDDGKGDDIKKTESIIQGTGTVLVIDDEPVLRELARSMLGQAGYEVITAKDGIEGTDIYAENKDKIDIVLLDMMMPNKNGKETFIDLKEMNSDVKVVMTSGFTKDKRVEDVLRLGARDFIQKPYTIFSLAEKIYKVMNEN
ncbi:MAG: response regulator [Candidatus Delongbacteria bacterium]|nr:response regulator [Candidatus Delongbacteria bacterium]